MARLAAKDVFAKPLYSGDFFSHARITGHAFSNRAGMAALLPWPGTGRRTGPA